MRETTLLTCIGRWVKVLAGRAGWDDINTFIPTTINGLTGGAHTLTAGGVEAVSAPAEMVG